MLSDGELCHIMFILASCGPQYHLRSDDNDDEWLRFFAIIILVRICWLSTYYT